MPRWLSLVERETCNLVVAGSIPVRGFSLCFQKNVLQNVIEIDPENQEFFQENFNSLKERLVKLDNEYTLKLNNEDWFMQYSPYVYYDHHCIVINNKHTIDKKAFLFSFPNSFSESASTMFKSL